VHHLAIGVLCGAHRVIEDGPHVGVATVVFEDLHAVRVVKCRHFGPHGVKEVLPGLPQHLAHLKQDRRAQRSRRVASEQLGHRRQGEPAITGLGEHPLARQVSQHPGEGWRMRAARRREILRAPRPIGQQIGDAQLGHGVQRLADAVPEDQSAEIVTRRDGLTRRGLTGGHGDTPPR
jgi:hypothetical protein